MVKIVYCITRLGGMSDEEFHRYWRDVHGPIAAKIPGCRKYVQSHAIPRAVGGRNPSFDGAAELWFDDWAALERAMTSPEVRAAIEDERNFIDHSRTAFFVAEEYQVM
ncbi:MAG TPA: EthD domain-containing protein [Candidatus Binataceae bacterium]|nr:EthD domain-containing protein [Candidatus Binataceae bacterium]